MSKCDKTKTPTFSVGGPPELRIPKIGDTVVFRHPASKDPDPELFKSPAVVTEVIERGREYDVSLCVLSATIGVAFRKKVPHGVGANEWAWYGEA